MSSRDNHLICEKNTRGYLSLPLPTGLPNRTTETLYQFPDPTIHTDVFDIFYLIYS